ncbi:hypothetical protein KQI52_05010 [bacterium]|nr:hypothetical protein [bacterium]
MQPRHFVPAVLLLSAFVLTACFTSMETVTLDAETPEQMPDDNPQFDPPAIQILPEDVQTNEFDPAYPPHPLDLPLGLWDVWGDRPWEFVIQKAREGDESWLHREFDRMNETNATFMIGNNANEVVHVHASELGQLNLGLALSSATTFADSAQFNILDERVPGSWGRYLRVKDVIDRFTQDADLSDPAVRQQAFDLIDEIVVSMRDDYAFDTRATPYYLLGKEGWERGWSSKNNREYSMLFEYAVNKIREWDRSRGIIYFGAYVAEAQREMFEPEKLEDPAILDSVFSGRLMRGWNVFNNETYPFRGKSGNRNWVLQNYAGRYYHRLMMVTYAWWLRDLTRDVERYAVAVNPPGPRPEWWLDLQVMREEWIYPDGKVDFRYRRPTRWEYASQAYIGLAVGARGITVFPYPTQLLMGQYDDMDGNPLPRQRAARTFKSHHKNIQGLTSGDWWQPDDTENLDMFRRPISEAANNPDYYPEGMEYEPYPGKHYPYDRVAELYANLRGLLPKVRALRWWWATDGLDTSYLDEYGNSKNVIPRRSLTEWMTDTTPVHRNLSLGDRFRLRALHGDDDGPLPTDDAKYSSNVLIGMFDDPTDPRHEMYLLVNLTTNEIVDDYIVPATEETVAQLVFDGGAPLEATILWQDMNRDDRSLRNEYRNEAGSLLLDVPLLPGDCKLIRVRSR